MAIGIENYTNIDNTDPTNYPNGRIKDDPAGVVGTPIEEATIGDYAQTFMRALEQAGITANNTPDNVANGYQYAKGFGLEAWTDLGTTLTVGADTGSFTVAAGDIIYNRYQLVGRTFKWQIQLRDVTVAGTPGIMVISMPAALVTLGVTFANDLQVQPGGWDGSFSGGSAGSVLLQTFNVSGGFGTDKILVSRADGRTFQNGTNDQVYYINVEAEII